MVQFWYIVEEVDVISQIALDFFNEWFKGNFGYCPRASFLRQETGKDVWLLSFDHFQIRINTGFRYVYVWWIFPHFLVKIKYLDVFKISIDTLL